MPENWKKYNLGDLSDDISYGYTESASKEEIGPKFLRITDIQNDFIDWKEVPYCKISEKDLIKYQVEIGDIVVARTGNSTGATSMIKNKINAVYASYLIRYRLNKKIAFPDFIDFVLRSNSWKNYVDAIKGGSAQPGANAKQFAAFEINLPPLQEQKSIASILSALDDKIGLNLQMNKTLEEMAMALYKHWFVDFGPFQDGEFVASEVGEIPKGWEVKPIGKVIETLGGGTPKTKISEYWENGTIDWYSPTDLTKSNSLFSLGTAKKITEKGLAKSSAKVFPKNSLLMSSRATIGAITISRNEACTNQGFITMIPNKTLSLYQLHGWTVHNMNLIISKANGSTFKEISKTNFRNLPIVVGNEIDEYKVEAKNYYDQIENNILENQTLTQLRDTLLPKLISGEVRVKDAKKTLSEVL
ncbi:restriction endonuclease subunit S [Salegentibacter sp. BDJ18]|uniref:restriction endonuclease subunit S n=1 Tax=Salegentibacter sp. BDJ18 TaxID=2816376 RepID=UPI001AAF6F3A|nr:restriction endonuclease subunit S [Salegentibacter sp. BDJ18]MBO2543622.1 restriction endonuclease subunit S [Salegentibacter sp. BDJ18]